jgi:oxygen-independent coproporphyrinogen-3 oxidase
MDDEAQREEYRTVREYLLGRGFHQYEISNFGLPGCESRHNRAYWDHSEVRGFGLAAASFLRGERFENSPLFSRYYEGEITGRETLSPEQLRLEQGMFGLRTFSLDEGLARPEKVRQLLSE